jgi:hypothetical protein
MTEFYAERDDEPGMEGRYLGSSTSTGMGSGTSGGRSESTTARARERVQEVAHEAADTLRSGVESARHGVERVTGTARERAQSLRQRTRQVTRRASEKAERLAGQVTELKATAEEKAAEMRDQAQQAMERARIETQRARERAVGFARENPLAVAAGALLAGAAVAALLPRTRRETELMGEKSSEIQQTAKQIAAEEARKATELAANAAESVLDEASKGLDSKDSGGRDRSGTADESDRRRSTSGGRERPASPNASSASGDGTRRQPSPS